MTVRKGNCESYFMFHFLQPTTTSREILSHSLLYKLWPKNPSSYPILCSLLQLSRRNSSSDFITSIPFFLHFLVDFLVHFLVHFCCDTVFVYFRWDTVLGHFMTHFIQPAPSYEKRFLLRFDSADMNFLFRSARTFCNTFDFRPTLLLKAGASRILVMTLCSQQWGMTRLLSVSFQGKGFRGG